MQNLAYFLGKSLVPALFVCGLAAINATGLQLYLRLAADQAVGVGLLSLWTHVVVAMAWQGRSE